MFWNWVFWVVFYLSINSFYHLMTKWPTVWNWEAPLSEQKSAKKSPKFFSQKTPQYWSKEPQFEIFFYKWQNVGCIFITFICDNFSQNFIFQYISNRYSFIKPWKNLNNFPAFFCPPQKFFGATRNSKIATLALESLDWPLCLMTKLTLSPH